MYQYLENEDDVVRRDCEDCDYCKCREDGPLFCTELDTPVHGDEASYCPHFCN